LALLPLGPVDFPGDDGDANAETSIDPNSKTAVSGFGPANFVAPDRALTYRIDFENDARATAPAQRVDVSDQLSNKLDWNTFQFTEVAFGDQFIAIPSGSQFFHKVVDVNSGVTDFQVAIDLDFNSATGQVTAQFQAINPTTGLPFSGLTGFLPPEDGTGRGQAHFNYVVRPVAGLSTGTQIRNVAIIQFDFGEIIDTNQVDPHDPTKGTDSLKEALITIDADAPTSAVNSLPASIASTSIPLAWSGGDGNGSGVAHFDVFVSDNGGPLTPFLLNTTQTSATFIGQVGHTYGFQSLATDHVGHVESPPSVLDATTRIVASPPADTTPPRVTSFKTTKKGKNLSSILVGFSEAMLAKGVLALGSYQLISAGKDRKFGTKDDKVLSLGKARYNQSRRLVTLTTKKSVALSQPLQLIVRGSGAITDEAGNALDGDKNATPGGDFVTRFGAKAKK
jgi:hypothetical protein